MRTDLTLLESIFQVEELEERLEMKQDITVTATVSSENGGSVSASIRWIF
jgi:hypothetical protein